MRAELTAWKALSVGTGIEPQRKPTGLGLTTSNLPTHCSSREPSEEAPNFSIDFSPRVSISSLPITFFFFLRSNFPEELTRKCLFKSSDVEPGEILGLQLKLNPIFAQWDIKRGFCFKPLSILNPFPFGILKE